MLPGPHSRGLPRGLGVGRAARVLPLLPRTPPPPASAACNVAEARTLPSREGRARGSEYQINCFPVI